MDRFDPFVKYADVYGDIINWEKDPMNKPQNQNKYFFSDGKTYYEQICKMLRLMSVFKEAFNQIYSNEDEISEAWENFVNNLSASVVEGSEPDVTLTWTDDSVNFEFTMVPGVPGEQGVGITSISFNSDYTMTITLSDGNSYTSMSLKGETGPQGPQGETGSGLQILDVYATIADLQSAHPTGQPGDAYQVGSAGNYTLYIWSSSQSAWVPAGSLGTVSPSTSNPLMNGTASAGSSDLYSRGDHVHPSDTSRASQEELDALIKTSQALIDQSFTYRESPAIQDGLARIDKIKGNTLVWNQLVQNGNFADTSRWAKGNGASSLVISNNEAVITIGGTWNNDIRQNQRASFISGHKYFASFEAKATAPITVALASFNATPEIFFAILTNLQTTFKKIASIVTAQSNADSFRIVLLENGSSYAGETFTVRNVQIIDLTKMGLDYITDPSDFTSLFPLSYYSYNQGSLLSFNGNGIKTTGKNLLPNSEYTTNASGATFKTINVDGFPVGTAILSCEAEDGTGVSWQNAQLQFRKGTTVISSKAPNAGTSFTLPDTGSYDNVLLYTTDALANKLLKWQLEYGTNPSEYEPYTSTTTSLPISTYFPTGMKSAGSAYDELTESKAKTRVGVIDLGTLTYTKGEADNKCFATTGLQDLIKPAAWTGSKVNAMCIAFTSDEGNKVYRHVEDKTMGTDGSGLMYFYDSAYESSTVEQFKSAMSNVYLYYELKTPTETSIDLDLSFKSYLDGTEQLFPVNGSVPSTSPIIADMTYLSIDDAMEYILDKLANVPQNTQQILASLEDDVADLQTDTGNLQTAVSGLQTSVRNINTNIGQLSSTVAGHTASISDMQSDISDLNTGLSNLEDTVTDNTSRIGTLETGLSATNGNVQNLETSVSDLDDTVTAQGTTVTALDSIIQDISNNPVVSALGSHELGFVAAYVEATLAANAGTRVTIPKPVIFPNNYTPLFIVGMSTGSSDVSICEIPPTFGSRDSVSCRVWNHGSQQTAQITVYILCMRQRQSQ